MIINQLDKHSKIIKCCHGRLSRNLAELIQDQYCIIASTKTGAKAGPANSLPWQDRQSPTPGPDRPLPAAINADISAETNQGYWDIFNH